MLLMFLATLAMVPSMVGFWRYTAYIAPYGEGVPYRSETGGYVLNNHGRYYEISRAVHREAARRLLTAFVSTAISIILGMIIVGGFLLGVERIRAILGRIVKVVKRR